MIRPITQADSAAIIALAVAAGLFPANDTAVLDKMLALYFGDNNHEGQICVLDIDDHLLGVAYYVPKPATDRTWELLMLAVQANRQGQGYGTTLLRYVENTLRENGQRLLLIETSGLPTFERTRRFYAQCGYEEETHIRDYYATGEDMVLFRKDLNANKS